MTGPCEFYDCDCPEREAIVTFDGLECGTCGVAINPDPGTASNVVRPDGSQ